eukprot:TRINITY_DN74192_c0_g1_i1.p1 TRINITY_DN74192_c0_g1~~TRINITY_DN74192_c0_g1_i1.p1  ORF type:complete len:401 (+),score=81.60 TRINITY_DN74192_c0_g1_i1:128-1330(+)
MAVSLQSVRREALGAVAAGRALPSGLGDRETAAFIRALHPIKSITDVRLARGSLKTLNKLLPELEARGNLVGPQAVVAYNAMFIGHNRNLPALYAAMLSKPAVRLALRQRKQLDLQACSSLAHAVMMYHASEGDVERVYHVFKHLRSIYEVPCRPQHVQAVLYCFAMRRDAVRARKVLFSMEAITPVAGFYAMVSMGKRYADTLQVYRFLPEVDSRHVGELLRACDTVGNALHHLGDSPRGIVNTVAVQMGLMSLLARKATLMMFCKVFDNFFETGERGMQSTATAYSLYFVAAAHELRRRVPASDGFLVNVPRCGAVHRLLKDCETRFLSMVHSDTVTDACCVQMLHVYRASRQYAAAARFLHYITATLFVSLSHSICTAYRAILTEVSERRVLPLGNP